MNSLLCDRRRGRESLVFPWRINPAASKKAPFLEAESNFAKGD
jgi:hypothetical protein